MGGEYCWSFIGRGIAVGRLVERTERIGVTGRTMSSTDETKKGRRGETNGIMSNSNENGSSRHTSPVTLYINIRLINQSQQINKDTPSIRSYKRNQREIGVTRVCGCGRELTRMIIS